MKKNNNHNIFDSVVNQDLCIGCGACLYSSDNNLEMSWNREGFLNPISKDYANLNELSLKACPFNPYPDTEVRTENEIAKIFLNEAPKRNDKIGYYYNTYAGYSKKYRLTSSSGGLSTYLIDELISNNIVDAVITVKEGKQSFYEYGIIRGTDNLLLTSKTKYYPVTLGTIINELKYSEERFAIVGIACFLKSVRLLQYYHGELRNKIKFTIGIICGGMKSSFFAEYLASKAGVEVTQFKDPQFRIKDHNSTASDYSFECKDKNDVLYSLKMKSVGDMWGSGMFKNKACDFCDDITTELADVSLGDAWLDPYNNDGKGTNVIITRSKIAEDIIQKGIKSNSIILNKITEKEFISSQQGNFNHRYTALGYRVNLENKKGLSIPPKRHDNHSISFYFKLVQKQRMVVRRLSLTRWSVNKDSKQFDKSIHKQRIKLNRLTKIYHYIKELKIRLNRLIEF